MVMFGSYCGYDRVILRVYCIRVRLGLYSGHIGVSFQQFGSRGLEICNQTLAFARAAWSTYLATVARGGARTSLPRRT